MKKPISKLLRIAIDGNEANIVNRVGSNVYAFEILANLYQLVKNKPVEVTVLLANQPIKAMPAPTKKWRYEIVTPVKFWTQWALPIHLFINSEKYDVFFTPGHYAPRFSSVPYVSSVMDLAYIHFPEQFKRRDYLQLLNWTNYSVKRAKKVVAISQFTKNDIIKNYHKKDQDVVVAYPAVYPPTIKIAPIHTQKVLRKFNLHKPYLLYIGTIQPRKNLINLVEAFEKICRQMPLGKRQNMKSLQLVIAGKIGWLADDIVKRIKSSPFKNQIVLTGFVTDFEKEVLITNCASLVLTGLYEGFGIPPLEAIARGVVPVVSNVSSLPEVVGEAGIQVNPSDPNEIAKGLKEVLTLSSSQIAKYKRHGQLQMAKFDWKNSAREILKTLEKVATHE